MWTIRNNHINNFVFLSLLQMLKDSDAKKRSGEKPITRDIADCPWIWMNVAKSTILIFISGSNPTAMFSSDSPYKNMLKNQKPYQWTTGVRSGFVSCEVGIQIIWVVWFTRSGTSTSPLDHIAQVATLFSVVVVVQPKNQFAILLVTLNSFQDSLVTRNNFGSCQRRQIRVILVIEKTPKRVMMRMMPITSDSRGTVTSVKVIHAKLIWKKWC